MSINNNAYVCCFIQIFVLPKKYFPIIHSSPTLLILAGRNSTAVKLLLGSFNFSTISKAAPIPEGLDAKPSGQFCIV